MVQLKFMNCPVGSCELLLTPKARMERGGAEGGVGCKSLAYVQSLKGKKKLKLMNGQIVFCIELFTWWCFSVAECTTGFLAFPGL